jgi:hypothetical protein
MTTMPLSDEQRELFRSLNTPDPKPQPEIIEAKAIFEEMTDLLEHLQHAKPEERSEMARRYAITITDFEKMMAYYHRFVVDCD